MPRELVLQDGVLSAVVTSFEPVELAQLEAEVNTKQEAVSAAQAQVDAATATLTEAQVALADAKSEHEVGTGLVGASAADSGSAEVETPADGADVAGQDPVAQQF
jgi:multidrug resistance efflux pump